ncbi:hypothetical protein GGS20DRAFT_309237 [Poronia punctata]|nr:hypothetical protein GGS20DRAFT_309237 [Poronia punctata]
MAQKTSDSDDQPNPSSSSTKESPGPAAAQKHPTSHTSNFSPAPAPPNAAAITPTTQFTPISISKNKGSSATINSSSTPNTPATASDITPAKAADSKHIGENAAHPKGQPMSKSNSAASNALPKDAMAGPSPYGTRSRNRGQARPNYAEDRDVDVEMEDAYPAKKEDEAKKGNRQNNAPTNGTSDTNRTTTSHLRKNAATDDAKTTNAHTSSKDVHQTTSTAGNATAASSSTSSKKRKAATQATANNVHSQTVTPTPTPNASTSTGTGTRRSATQATAQANRGYRETNMLSFEKCNAIPRDGKMVADDGTVLQANDHVYLVCEPPGEPYYLGRIMEFLHVKNDSRKPVDALRINWYYRPKDIGKRVNDTRLVFATMHSDISPLTALRGKCQIKHKAEIDDMDTFRKTPDCFYYEKLYDRYIQKHYDVIPCFQIVNVPEKVKKVLDERWKYILVEQGRAKEFTSAVKLCKRCGGYCASHDSVDCAVCQRTYHMNCVRPVLQKKPSRGFAWACAACSRAQERKLEARNTPSQVDTLVEGEEEEFWDEEDDAIDTSRTSPTDGIDDTHQPATPEQIYQASLWPYRYLGQHCKPEDALDYDDRIYPRAGSRLGPKHQATVLPWPGRPVKLVKPIEMKKAGKKEGRATKEAFAAAMEAERLKREKRPWIQDEPPGYVARGEDYDNDDPRNTAQLLWKPCDDTEIVPFAGYPKPPKSKENLEATNRDSRINQYLRTAKTEILPKLSLPKESTNFLDVAINTLFKHDFKTGPALKSLGETEKVAFKEPDLTPVEIKKFEEGVAKFGSELYLVSRHVKNVKHSRIVRFYYAWKKTDRGKQIWGNFSGRKGKKEAKKAEEDANKLQDDVADDQDDSAFDTDKALERKRNFTCKFCSTKSSRQWRRAPNSASTIIEGSGKGANKEKIQYIVALCRRCAELWRRYAIQWEDMEDLAKKVAAAGGRSWKRRVDEELLKELRAAEDMMSMTVFPPPARASPAARATPPAASSQPPAVEPPPRKKLKTIADRQAEQNATATVTPPAAPPKKKEKIVEKPPPPPPPPAPELPKLPPLRTLPCVVCSQSGSTGEKLLCCKECRLTVHRACYGVPESWNRGKWTCDMCLNDKFPQVSIDYKCVLCPVEKRDYDFVDPPKISHKKKTEKERERERNERDLAHKAVELYKKRQLDLRRPVNPREALKRTADNNWVHVTCAVWTPEIKFSSAKSLSLVEGIPSIPRARYEEVCKVCKEKGGACVPCGHCRHMVHVECAHKNGDVLGFEVIPVKGSRKDQHNIVTLRGETGYMAAHVWCKEHVPPKSVLHHMHDIVDPQHDQSSSVNALQLYVRNFKQADLALTGTARKANLATVAIKTTTIPPPAVPNKKPPSASVVASTATDELDSPATQKPGTPGFKPNLYLLNHPTSDKACITCGTDASPRWHAFPETPEKIFTSSHAGKIGKEAQRFLAQRQYQCHKCHRANRQPVPHISPPVEQQQPQQQQPQTQPQPQPVEAPPALRPPPAMNPNAGGVAATPHHASNAVSRLAGIGTGWGTRSTPTPTPTPAPAPAPVPAPAPTRQPSISQGPPHILHGRAGSPPQPLSLTAPRTGPSPVAVPTSVSVPVPSSPAPLPRPNYSAPSYIPPGSTIVSEWLRSPPRTHRQLNTNPSAPSSIHLNHLRDLRPPPINSMPNSIGSVQHGLGPSMMIGRPSSPRQVPPRTHNGAPPYVSPWQASHNSHNSHISHITRTPPQPPLHSLTNGGIRATDHPFQQGLLPQRSSFSATSHGSPPLSRDGMPMNMNHEANLNSNHAPPRQNDGRPANGASASPSLRNLLS